MKGRDLYRMMCREGEILSGDPSPAWSGLTKKERRLFSVVAARLVLARDLPSRMTIQPFPSAFARAIINR